MVRGKKKAVKKQKVLSQTEVANIKEERKDLQDTLASAEGTGIGTPAEQINKSLIKSQIERFDKIIEEAKPGRLTGMQRDALGKREKELENFFQVGLPTRYEMDHPAKCPGAVRKHMAWTQRTKVLVKEYRDIQRLLRPGEERSIEQLRKDGARSQYA